jgi:hypothetical protein
MKRQTPIPSAEPTDAPYTHVPGVGDYPTRRATKPATERRSRSVTGAGCLPRFSCEGRGDWERLARLGVCRCWRQANMAELRIETADEGHCAVHIGESVVIAGLTRAEAEAIVAAYRRAVERA